MISRKFEPVLFGFILSGLMSFVVSGISTVKITGPDSEFLSLWIGAWATAWVFAFPIALVMAPLARRMVRLVTSKD